ncbi:hypothetical protein EA58_14160 [Photobacterium galatheae]|uniref:Uncharacterized protein n=1 Tax=Photobacterium galatheae TaxID=1654360 RepID=A0A066RKN0_9GAMM|nr:hypothetical protein EA58_14160 [Photobacterium galatheae]
MQPKPPDDINVNTYQFSDIHKHVSLKAIEAYFYSKEPFALITFLFWVQANINKIRLFRFDFQRSRQAVFFICSPFKCHRLLLKLKVIIISIFTLG